MVRQPGADRAFTGGPHGGPDGTFAVFRAGHVVSTGAGASEEQSGVRVIRISGAAVEHQDLISLLEQLNGTRMFRSVTIEQARRDKLGDREAIGFTLVCEW